MRARSLALVLIAWSASPIVSGQELPRGTVIDKVACARDPNQSYALYLPTAYSADRTWPILYAFDPGARGRLPVERFRDAAERLGVIVAGSNNSRNGPLTASVDAMNAMYADTRARFGLNLRRIYVTGFSGGARVAATIGLAMKGQVAGVIGVGAGFPEGVKPSAPVPFAFFGAVGTDDFNYPELRQLEQALGAVGARHRLEIFTGSHDWPPETVCSRALEWMELRAMQSGARTQDPEWLDGFLSRGMAAAAGDESAGRLLEAYWLYAALSKDLAGLRDVSACERRAAELERRGEVRRGLKELKDSIDRQEALEATITQLARRARAGPAAEGAEADLLAMLSDARKKADAARQSSERMAARRVLAASWAQFGSAATDDMASGRFEPAAMCYRAMARVRPENAQVEYGLACACARGGNRKDAIEALRRAVGKGFTDVSRLKADPNLDSLRGERAFRQIVEALVQKEPERRGQQMVDHP